MMAFYSLAHSLNKTIREIEQMTVTEFNGWIAYFELRAENGD